MLKFLLKNPKRITRNLLIVFLGYLLVLAAFGLVAYFLREKLVSIPLYITVIVTGSGSLTLTFLVVAILSAFANRRDAELRRRYQNEVNSLDTSKIAKANGIINTDTLNTVRDTKSIKKELVDLQIELYHAQERDKNLKLAKKF
ncbi:hypothetical protein [Spiroplasma apis]|uniref:Uncharacterized protein n=1 Tax=Spiroplasma apis B31 TaxID=1276258 RepID=V5RIZ8_SPIAP|nr:hypothetical protein [Spiroplasma apis]AHB36061.1 hypothetical protein SAPIS_v1c02150 [Spiroplasma apis B31]